MYYVNVNGKYYRFVDVPGNGNCFYYSVLRHQSLEQRFDKSDSASLRQYLSSVVSTCFRDDEVVQNLFEYEGVNYKNWCKSIETDGRWKSTFDMMIFSYVMKTNVITVGNYLNGFSIQSMKNYFHTINPHLEVSDQGFIPEHPQIHIFFHIHKSPLVGASSGNHFGYLQPIESASEIRKKFRSVGVSVVLSADETFIRFNESCNHCIAPKGIKRVGLCAKENDKAGVTLLPTLDMIASRLLPPLIIFKAKFGARLMKQWATYTSIIVFTFSAVIPASNRSAVTMCTTCL